VVLCTALVAVTSPEAFALIIGGEGNAPIRDSGWPTGAASIYDSGLTRPATIVGRITDNAGQPLADVELQIQDVTTSTGVLYKLPLHWPLGASASGSAIKTEAVCEVLASLI
jgi:hypothetical protein